MNMRILPIQQYNNQRPTFTSWDREVRNANGDLLYRNDTRMFRGDIEWEFLAHFMNAKYKDVDKINVYNFACSDGSEAYTFLISMLYNAPPSNVRKFLPIKAYGGVGKQRVLRIKKAKKGGLELSRDERFAINWDSSFGLRSFFEKDKDNTYKPKAVLTKNIIFKKGDITKEYKKIKSENSVVFARNFLPYLGAAKAKELIQNLGEVMGENSYLILGNYDKCIMLDESDDCLDVILAKAGFKPTMVDNVFEKKSPKTNVMKFDSVIV